MDMKCPKCGYEGNSKFCPDCGSEMVEIEERDSSEKTEDAISSTTDILIPKKSPRKSIKEWSLKKKILVGIGAFAALLLIIVIILFIVFWPDSISKETKAEYKYESTIHACGFVLDNTTAKLLVRPNNDGDGFFAVNDVDLIFYEVYMTGYWEDETDIETLAKEDQENDVMGSRKDIGEVEDIDIAGCKCKTFTYTEKYYYKIYYIQSDDEVVYVRIRWYNDDFSDISKIIESMEKDNTVQMDSVTKEDDKQIDADPTSGDEKESDNSKKSVDNTDSTASKKREIEDMDDDEVFMVMALAEKEIKNNLTYDAKKAKFSHIKDNWYMSEQDGNYTVMTTFEAPNEYGTMQKAGAVVSFTVTSKSDDGWGYKDEDVYIEWK